jgi:hypothetical protein
MRVRWIGGLLLFPAVAYLAVLAGAWWAPFLVALLFGIVQPRARLAVPFGALIGLVAWLIPLVTADSQYGIGPTAGSLAAIMGLGHQGAIPVVLTCVVGLLLGLTGAWLGSAARSLAYPAISR